MNKMETYTFYQWWAEPICVVQAPTDATMEELLVLARDFSLGQRLDYYQKKSERDQFQAFLDKCQQICGGDESWMMGLSRSHIKGELTLADLNDMLNEITYRIPNKNKEYPYI